MMPNIRWPICLLLLLANLPLIGQDSIRAQVDVVVVPISVRDSKGNPVENLRREDFRIFEDGRPQELRTVSSDSPLLSVAVMIDTYVSNNVVPGPSPVNRKIEIKTNRRGLKLSYRTGYLQYGVLK
jgi:hypothetical protein